jgi:hypothetical protein
LCIPTRTSLNTEYKAAHVVLVCLGVCHCSITGACAGKHASILA